MKGISRVASIIGSPLARAIAVTCAALTLWRRHRPEAALIVLSVGGTAAVNKALKLVIERRRPLTADSTSSSFPSGHSSGASAAALTAAYVLWRLRGSSAGASAALLGALVAGTIAVARVQLGEHHPGDVAGGLLLGTAWTGATVYVFEHRVARSSTPS